MAVDCSPILLLASSSPRRAQLLSTAGFDFRIIRGNIAEKTDVHLTACELTGWNAVRKGLTMAKRHPEAVVLAADTVVALKDEIIGKPNDLSEAVRILQRLNGQTHHVCSSVFIAHLADGRAQLFCEVSKVRFRKLSESQIRTYLAKIDPLDKAGAYAAQGYGSDIIARIDGSYSNVVGLPMEQTIPALKQFGIHPSRRSKPRSRVQALPEHAPEGVHGAKRGRGTTR